MPKATAAHASASALRLSSLLMTMQADGPDNDPELACFLANCLGQLRHTHPDGREQNRSLHVGQPSTTAALETKPHCLPTYAVSASLGMHLRAGRSSRGTHLGDS